MTVFDLEKDDLLRLSPAQLEELIARLAEAEVASVGYGPGRVHRSGSIDSPDGGVDIRVVVPATELDTGFPARPDTIVQVKKSSMPPSAIKKEMRPGGTLSPAVSRHAAIGGSYIIACPAHDCPELMKERRLKAMRESMGDDPNETDIHLDFLDHSRLRQWLRQHPAVMLWVKDVLGKALSGWRPHEAWSNPPHGADDTLILAPGISIVFSAGDGRKLCIEEAIGPMRDLVRTAGKAIRVVGLSGVGKTRIVQALFEESVGEDALDKTVAIYADVGAGADPSANAMLERLIAEKRRAIVVLDNCPSGLHSTLASRLSSAGSKVSLITVEYDIGDDQPQMTEVIHIEAEGPDVAKRLLLRRFPDIGHGNAERIAGFADGNARISLAIAERVEKGESLALLSDASLFDRLFEQRKQPDGELRTHARALALVYSFSVSDADDDLAILASICEASRSKLFGSVAELLERRIAQKRSHWRAVLPHAIANRLADEALAGVPVGTLRKTFETPGRKRLLMSFAHRLGSMHDHSVAREIVGAWLQPDGLLGRPSSLNENEARILDYVAPVAPDAVLDRIGAEIDSDGFNGVYPLYSPRMMTMFNLLQSLAYEPDAFERCVGLLMRVADFEDGSHNHNDVRDPIVRFFQAYLSGTRASPDRRLKVVRETLRSDVPARRSLGFRMLSTALAGPPWFGMGINDFGARPRDDGFRPDPDQLAGWRRRFIDLAVETGLETDPALAGPARTELARRFRELWRHRAIRPKLVEAAGSLNGGRPWVEGWKAVRSIIEHDYRKAEPEAQTPPEELTALEAELAPSDLIAGIRAYVLATGLDDRALDGDFHDGGPGKYQAIKQGREAKAEELGEAFARSGQAVSSLGPDLFSTGHISYGRAFGRGLARGTPDRQAMWDELVEALHRAAAERFDCTAPSGFIEEIDRRDRPAARALLDRCLGDARLRTVLVELHPPKKFDENDLDRCVEALRHPEVNGWMHGELLWNDAGAGLPRRRLLDLAWRLLDKPDGDKIVLRALSLRIDETQREADALGADFRRVGLVAAARCLRRSQEDPSGSEDRDMQNVVEAALSFEGNDDRKKTWLDAIFSAVDEQYDNLRRFGGAVRTTAAKAPGEFLDRVFSGDAEARPGRKFFIERAWIGIGEPPLGAVEADALIDWCERQADPTVWPVVAAGIDRWATDDAGDLVELGPTAMKLLEAAPRAEDILKVYADSFEPRVYSVGGRWNIMERGVSAIAALKSHPDPKIASAAKTVADKFAKKIEDERRSERRRAEEREQRFE